MFIEFPLPMLIPVLCQDGLLQTAPALLGAFALGPVYGVVISFISEEPAHHHQGTSTACVGGLCNFMLGAVFSLWRALSTSATGRRKTAILGAIAGAAVVAHVQHALQLLHHLRPATSSHMPLVAILGMYQAILPSADS